MCANVNFKLKSQMFENIKLILTFGHWEWKRSKNTGYCVCVIENMFYKCKKRIWGKCCKVCRSGFKRSICLGLRLSRSQVIYQFLAHAPNGKLYKWSSSMKFTFLNSFEDEIQARFVKTSDWFLPGLKCISPNVSRRQVSLFMYCLEAAVWQNSNSLHSCQYKLRKR